MDTTHPTFILGIHHFCDHRCWRCPMSHRCAVFARWQDSRCRQPAPTEPAGRVAVALALSLEVTMEEAALMMEAARGHAPAAHAGQFSGVVTSPPGETATRAEDDPMVVRGAEYARLTWPVVRALRPILRHRGDQISADATERLEEMCATLASKIFRAVSSSAETDVDAGIQTDANGSAKVALLLIEESRQAWRAMMQPGLAAGDGAPPRFVALLDALEADLLRRFPRAFEFVRPGFDTGEATGATAEIARAVLQPGSGRAS